MSIIDIMTYKRKIYLLIVRRDGEKERDGEDVPEAMRKAVQSDRSNMSAQKRVDRRSKLNAVSTLRAVIVAGKKKARRLEDRKKRRGLPEKESSKGGKKYAKKKWQQRRITFFFACFSSSNLFMSHELLTRGVFQKVFFFGLVSLGYEDGSKREEEEGTLTTRVENGSPHDQNFSSLFAFFCVPLPFARCCIFFSFSFFSRGMGPRPSAAVFQRESSPNGITIQTATSIHVEVTGLISFEPQQGQQKERNEYLYRCACGMVNMQRHGSRQGRDGRRGQNREYGLRILKQTYIVEKNISTALTRNVFFLSRGNPFKWRPHLSLLSSCWNEKKGGAMQLTQREKERATSIQSTFFLLSLLCLSVPPLPPLFSEKK